MDTLLRVRNLTIRFKIEKKIIPVIEALSFNLKKGKTTALVGESGSGKSITALAIMGLLPSPPVFHLKAKFFPIKIFYF